MPRLTVTDLPEHYRAQVLGQSRSTALGNANCKLQVADCGEDERELQREVEAFLAKRGCVLFHLNGETARGNLAGLPDLLVWAPGGRHLLIELKSRKGALRPEQVALHRRLRENGHAVLVARSVCEVTDYYLREVWHERS